MIYGPSLKMPEKSQEPAVVEKPLDSVEATVMSHFYRGELGRMTAWRERFDRTTHWAIITTTGIITFSWTNAETSHFFFLLSNTILYLLLTIEARRYRFYDAYRGRVRILESHFIFPVVTQNPKRVPSNWRRLVGADLIMPSLKISFWEALSRRFNRNYIWLFLLTLLAWITLTFFNVPKVESFSDYWRVISERQSIPLYITLPIAGVFYLYLLWVGLHGLRTRRASGEFQKRPGADARDWSL